MADDYNESSKSPSDWQRTWVDELTTAKKSLEKWHKKADGVLERYLDKADQMPAGTEQLGGAKLNLFYSNTNNLLAMLFARIPKPEVNRRFRDPDDQVGRVASNILRRAIITESDTQGYFTTTSKDILKDRLLPGAGVAWIRYTPQMKPGAQEDQITDNLNEELSEEQKASPIITEEHVSVEHVHWKDFLWSPARAWDEVRWVARRAYLCKEEFEERFPNASMLSAAELRAKAESYKNSEDPNKDDIQVWEIWDKPAKKRFFICELASELLEEKDDPLGLPHFFPCPKPLFAATTTSTLVPTPDYHFVQDQYTQLNVAVARKAHLVDACKVLGVYDGENGDLQRLLDEPEGTLVAVNNYASMAEKGGLQGTIDWLPISSIAENIQRLNLEIENLKGQIAEITGISDIVRGATSPYETASAQGMKAQFASIRLQSLQQEIAEFFGEMFSLKAFLMAKFYSPDTLLRKAGALPPSDAQYAQSAVALLKNELLAHTLVEVSVDALQAPNQQQLAQETAAVMTSIAQLMGQGLPVLQAKPEFGPLFLGLIKKQVSTMPGAREIEGLIDQELSRILADPNRGAKPDPAHAQVQQEQEMEKQRLAQQQAIEKNKADAVIEAKRIDADLAEKELDVKKGENQAKGQIAKTELEIKARELRLREIEAITAARREGIIIDPSELELPLGSGLDSDREGEMAGFIQFMDQYSAQQKQFLANQQAAFASFLSRLGSAPSSPEVVQFNHDERGDVASAVVIPIKQGQA